MSAYSSLPSCHATWMTSTVAVSTERYEKVVPRDVLVTVK